MIELGIVILILAAFSFPVYISAGCLGLYTTWFMLSCYESLKNQPLEGKKVLYSTLFAFLINLVISLGLSFTLAFLIFYIIFDYYYLFIFNLLFCFFISIRWFNFSYKIFQWMVGGRTNNTPDSNKFFAICKGLKKNSGLRLTPAFTDAGFIKKEGDQLSFNGTFYNSIFRSKNILSLEKKSSEKIRIHTQSNFPDEPSEFLIILKNQFYPFRSRKDRDMLFDFLSSKLNTSTA
ncbi:MAG: hypothetical protein VW455_12875 [Nitrospinota bacterium]